MEIRHDEAGGRFYIPLEGGLEATLRYRRTGAALDFYQTDVPLESRERGLAEQLVETAFRYAQTNNLKVIPTCSYVSEKFLKKRPEFLPLVVGP